jgi:hypothetical protein
VHLHALNVADKDAVSLAANLGPRCEKLLGQPIGDITRHGVIREELAALVFNGLMVDEIEVVSRHCSTAILGHLCGLGAGRRIGSRKAVLQTFFKLVVVSLFCAPSIVAGFIFVPIDWCWIQIPGHVLLLNRTNVSWLVPFLKGHAVRKDAITAGVGGAVAGLAEALARSLRNDCAGHRFGTRKAERENLKEAVIAKGGDLRH